MDTNNQIQAWVNTIDDFLISIDINGIILRVNQAWVDFCVEQNVRESLWKVGSDYFKEFEKLGKERELNAIKQVLTYKKKEHKQMYPLLLGNGDTQWLEVKVRRLEFSSGTSTEAIISHKPITLQAMEPITAEIILDSMTEGFCLLDDQFHLIYINEIAEKLLQSKRGLVMGRGLFEVFPETVGTYFHSHYQHALEEQAVVEFVDYYQPLDIWFKVKACPLKKGGLALYLQDVSERKKTEAQLAESANYDYLTGLPNRRLITQMTRSLLSEGKKFTVFHLNIHNLNFINAVQYYDAGDTIMRKLSEELKGFAHEKCHIARMDGNQFVILKETSLKERLTPFAEQIEEIFHKPVLLDTGQKIQVCVNIGIACYPYDGQTMEEVYSYAEMAMHEAKTVRGSCHAFFRPRMKSVHERKAAIVEGLAGDFKKSGFYYTMQPQINGDSGKLIGVEVLSRWAHPNLGEISPFEFIQVAEETGDIVPLTFHLLTEVFTQLKSWENRYEWKVRAAINMTPSLISNTDFFDQFFVLMKDYEIDPKQIEIEITEQAELTYSPKTLENLLLCKSKGMSIAIDDFGTGFSMISYLTHFPITKIKIDKSFVQKIGQDSKSEAVLKSLIHLAKSIECELVAEGVEREEEAEFLQANGCSVYQGYLYDKPLKVEDLERKYLELGQKSLVMSQALND